MLEVILDTETTGLSTTENHRIVEIGCIELKNQIVTNNVFHEYINPQRPVSKEAFDVHGYSDKFLSDKKNFSEVVDNFLNFIKNKKLIIHNAEFDLAHLNNELSFVGKQKINTKNVVDTLELAKEKFHGSQVNLDALCKRFRIDNSRRVKHTALIDCELLSKVYINLIDQKEPTLDFKSVEKEKLDIDFKNLIYCKKVILPTNEEIKKHKEYLKSKFNKNFFN